MYPQIGQYLCGGNWGLSIILWEVFTQQLTQFIYKSIHLLMRSLMIIILLFMIDWATDFWKYSLVLVVVVTSGRPVSGSLW